MTQIIGIDLGTTFSSAGWEDDNGNVRVAETSDGKRSIPSVVFIDGDTVTVGEQAMHRWLLDRDKVCRWVKRAMGEPLWMFPRRRLFSFAAPFDAAVNTGPIDDDVRQKLIEHFAAHGVTLSDATSMRAMFDRWDIRDGDKAWIARRNADGVDVYEGMTAVDISAEILKYLKSMAESQLGMPVEDAVITCPAYFNAMEVANTRRAGELAGFVVKEVVKEPVAAAVCHGIERMKEGEQIMICDLGGGTFDATILAMRNGEFHPLATIGDRKLGGHDWTEELASLVRERFMDRHALDPTNDPHAEQALYEACEAAKRMYETLDEVEIACTGGDVTDQILVTRGDFEDRTEYRMAKVLDACQQCLEKAELQWSDLNGILLVGGSARLRRFSEALREASGLTPQMSRSPDMMVVSGAATIAKRGLLTREEVGAIGACEEGGLAPVVIIRRINERALATRVYNPDKGEIVSAVIMPAKLEIPDKRSCDAFSVSVDAQEFFDIPIMEFEEYHTGDETARVEATANFRFYCRAGVRAGDRIRVTLGYGKSAEVYATAEDLTTNKSLRVEQRPYKEPDLAAVKVTVKPRWYVFALDTSGSMDEADKIGSAKTVLLENARQILAAGAGQCKIGIVTFDDTAKRVCGPTDNIRKIESKVAPIVTGCLTAMHEGIQMAEDLVMTAPAGTDRFVVLVTDGMPNDSDTARSAAAHARSRGVTLVAAAPASGEVDTDFLSNIADVYDLLDFSSVEGMREGMGQLLSMVSGGGQGGRPEGLAGGLSEDNQWK
jgi:molecular chaperone DnaK